MSNHNADEAKEEAAPWIERLARLGYTAKGVVYVLVGFLAARAAFEFGTRASGSRGALSRLVEAPFGRVILGIIALGLVGYVLWRLVEAFWDPNHKGSDWKGLTKRTGYVLSAGLYGLLAFAAARLALGGGSGSGGRGGSGGSNRPERWTAMVMEQSLGRWLVGLVGVGVIAFGIYEIYKAVAKDIRKHLDLTPLGGDTRPWIVRLGRFGIAARAVVFGIIGYALVQAALDYQPQEARGLGGALRTLQQQPYGPWLLAIVALGLIAYGLYQLARARYRRIEPEKS